MSNEEIAGRDSRLADEVDSPAMSLSGERVPGDVSGITDTPAAGAPPTTEDTANSGRPEEDTEPPSFPPAAAGYVPHWRTFVVLRRTTKGTVEL